MPSGSDIRAGRAFVEITTNNNPLSKGLAAASKRLRDFGQGVKEVGVKLAEIGGAVTAPLIGAAKSFASIGSELGRMSKRTGIGVQTLSALSYAADQADLEMGTLEKGIRKMQRTLAGAAEGSGSAQEALAKLGLTVQDLKDKSPDEQLLLIADRISKIQSPALKAASAIQLFGKSGAELLPLFNEGAGGVRAMMEEAKAAGLVMSGEDAAAAETFERSLKKLWFTIKMGVATMGGALAPTLGQTAGKITAVVSESSRWIGQHRELIGWLFKGATVVSAAGLGLTILGKVIGVLGMAFSGLSTLIALVVSVFGVLAGIVAFFLTPLGLVIAALTAFGVYLAYSTGVAGKALTWLSNRFGDLRDFATEALGGIADALAAGDVELAAQILWAAFKLIWQRGIGGLDKLWQGLKHGMVDTWHEAISGIAILMLSGLNLIENAWSETTAFLSETWTNFTSWVSSAWSSITNFLEKSWNKIKGLFDKDFDAAAANNAADQELEAGQKKIEEERQKTLGDRETRRKSERADQDKELAGAVDQIGENLARQEAQSDKAQNDAVAADEKQLEDLKAQFKALTAKAHLEKKARDAAGPEGPKGPPKLDAQGMADKLAGVGMSLGQEKIGVAGTFNAAEAQGLRAGAVTDRLSKAAEDTAKNTKEMLDLMKNGVGVAFE